MNPDHAKRLRRNMTDAEKLLWRHLRAHRLRGEKFRRQQPIGDYIVDFVHFGARLVIEADGGQHHESTDDSVRDAWLRGQGFNVLRFWNTDILTNTVAVVEKVAEALQQWSLHASSDAPSPLPLSREGRGERQDKDLPADGGRQIRSFVRREGRMTPAQRRALSELWPRYGIEHAAALQQPQALYPHDAPLHCEIGFGNGEALAAMAIEQPQRNYLGIEVHRPGIGSLLRRLAAANIANVRLYLGDANEALVQLPDAALAAVYLFFPDPWPKKRHHKRRLVQPAFAALIARKLAPGGVLHVATDWADYATHIAAVLQQTSGLAADSAARPRPPTKYERHAAAEMRAVREIVFIRAE